MILKTVIDQQPRLRGTATLAAASALGHPHEDVQEAAVQLVDRWADPGDFQLSEILVSHRDQVAAPIRPRIDSILAKTVAADGKTPQSESSIPPAAESAESDWERELQNRKQAIERLPVRIRQLLGLDDSWESCRQGRLGAFVAWKPLDIPILSGQERIAPIQSLDELFDAVEHAIEMVEQGNELERVMDAISRMCNQRPDDFERCAKPLIKRIEKIQSTWGNPTRGLLSPLCDRGIVPLLMAWLAGSSKVSEFWSGIVHYGNTWRMGLVSRLTALAKRVERGIAAPVLATPTHRAGWIDPMVWAKRWQCLESLNLEPPKVDLIQSLLRLAPEGREAALEQAKSLKTPYREAVVWALGGTANFSTAKKIPDVWLAAGRCRDPEISLVGEEWAEKLPPGPDVLQPAAYRWVASTGVPHMGDTDEMDFTNSGGAPFIKFELNPPLAPSRNRPLAQAQPSDGSQSSLREFLLKSLAKEFDLPEGSRVTEELTGEMNAQIDEQSASSCTRSDPYDLLLMTALGHKTGGDAQAKWVNQLGPCVWPAKLDGYWMSAVKDYVLNLEEKTSNAYSALLEPLFQQDQLFSELAALALLIASQCKNAEIRTTALDAWIALIADGRGDARLLGNVLGRLCSDGWLRLNRLTAVLREASRVSPLHAWTIAEMLQDLVAAYAELPADAHYVLQLLRELLVELGLRIRPELRSKLETNSGSGKTAKLARQLAALTDTKNPAQQTALLQLLNARIQRANRWNGV